MTASERAAQIWPLLTWAATQRQTLTYGQLGRLIGVPAAGLGQLLEPIQSYCLVKDIPPLTILVVSKKSGMPGDGFVAAHDIPRSQAAVYAFRWLDRQPPTSQDLETAVTSRPSNGIAVPPGEQE